MGEVVLEGLYNVTSAEARRNIRTVPGHPFSSQTLSGDLARLEAMGAFESVKAEPRWIENQLVVVYTFREKPFVRMIRLEKEGVKRALSETKLLELVETEMDKPVSETQLDADVLTVKRYLRSKGFPDAEVSWETTFPDARNRMQVVFDVDTGKRVRIGKLIVDSEVPVKRRVLKRGLVNKPAILGLFKGQFEESALSQDRQMVRRYFQGKGYLGAEVGEPETTLSSDGKRMEIRYEVEEGPLFRLESISFSGNEVLTEQELREKVDLQEGDVLSLEKLSVDLQEIKEEYWSKGYAYCELDALYPQPGEYMDQERPRVPVTITVVERGQFSVGQVSIVGNHKTMDEVIRREIKLVPGDLLDVKQAQISQRKISNTGYFEDVAWDVEAGEEADERDLLYQVKEMNTGDIRLGFGYSSVDQIMGFVAVEQRNFDISKLLDAEAWRTGGPVGAGQTLRVGAEFGSRFSEYDISFTEPWFMGHPVSLGGAIYNREREYDDFTVGTAGLSTTLGHRLERWDFVKGYLTYRIENIDISDVEDDASQELKAQEGDIRLASVTFTVDRDSRDYPFDPYSGYRLKGSAELGSVVFGGEADFWKCDLEADGYLPTMKGQALRGRARFGLGDSLGGDTFPLSERFYAGGSQTLRGFESREVGPRDDNGDIIGGRTRLLFTAEYKFRISNAPRMNLVLFSDAGNVWSDVGEFGELKVSLGVGWRILVPIPIELSFATVLNGDDEQDTEPISFGLGFGF